MALPHAQGSWFCLKSGDTLDVACTREMMSFTLSETPCAEKETWEEEMGELTPTPHLLCT